jgi:hypothetical protein
MSLDPIGVKFGRCFLRATSICRSAAEDPPCTINPRFSPAKKKQIFQKQQIEVSRAAQTVESLQHFGESRVAPLKIT